VAYQIQSYNVSVAFSRAAGTASPVRERIIEVIGPRNFHGGLERAYLVFSTVFDAWVRDPVCGYLTTSDPFNPMLSGWFPATDFDAFHAVLSDASPTVLDYTVVTINGVTNYVSRITVSSGAAQTPGRDLATYVEPDAVMTPAASAGSA